MQLLAGFQSFGHTKADYWGGKVFLLVSSCGIVQEFRSELFSFHEIGFCSPQFKVLNFFLPDFQLHGFVAATTLTSGGKDVAWWKMDHRGFSPTSFSDASELGIFLCNISARQKDHTRTHHSRQFGLGEHGKGGASKRGQEFTAALAALAETFLASD